MVAGTGDQRGDRMKRWLFGLAALLAGLALGLGGALAASERYVLPGDNVFPEGIALGLGGAFYVGSTTTARSIAAPLARPRSSSSCPAAPTGAPMCAA